MHWIRKHVYLDNNATTSLSSAVIRKMTDVIKHEYGNPSALYSIGQRAAALLDDSRKKIAEAIHADYDEIYFTGSASEGNNAVLKGAANWFSTQKTTILATPIEHSSVMETLRYLQTKGITVEIVPVDSSGVLNLARLEELISPRVFLICCMFANNEIGTVQDVRSVAEIARRHGVLLFSDCVQALGKIPVDVKVLGLDYATFSAHKIHGPKGVGAVYVKKGSPLLPWIHGGHQEEGYRAGTESLHNICGFAEACRALPRLLAKSPSVAALKKQLERGIREIKPDVEVISPADRCLPNTLSIRFPDVSNALLLAALDDYGISVSAGSACNSQENAPSHVLSAIGLTEEEARQTIRFSLSTTTRQSEIRHVVRSMRSILIDQTRPIRFLNAKSVTETMLFDENVFVLDVRFRHDRMMLKSLPNAHEVSFPLDQHHVHHLPKNRNIVVVCQAGIISPFVAFFLRRKGFQSIGVLKGGLLAWKIQHPHLYDRLAGKNISRF
jgi:cysteine desulfurase